MLIESEIFNKDRRRDICLDIVNQAKKKHHILKEVGNYMNLF